MFIFYLWLASIVATCYIADQKKFSMVGYCFLALFLGPIAVVLVLMVPKAGLPKTQDKQRSVDTLEEASRELQNIRQTHYVQEQRIKYLEELIEKISNTSTPLQAPTAAQMKIEMPQEKIVEPISLNIYKPQVEIPKEIPSKKSDMELDFGRNWLNKIGIAVLALGIAFLISYTFKYFGPFLKIAFGYLVAVVLFLVGAKLEKTERLANFARALLAGAWGIVYFTTYAMHHFESSRLIASQGADLILLAVVIIAMMGHVLKYKSEGMMAGVLLVAYMTLTIGQVSEFTLISLLFLAVLVLFFVHKFQWIKTLSLGLIATYALHLIWLMPKLTTVYYNNYLFGMPSYSSHDLLNFIFLSCYAAVFFIGTHLVRLDKDEDSKQVMAASNLGNIATYSILAYPLIVKLFYSQRITIVLVVGIIYLVSALIMKKLNQHKMYLCDVAAALFMLTFSITLTFQPTDSVLVWLIEIPFLLFIGSKFKENIYKYASYVLTIYMPIKILGLSLYLNVPAVHVLGFVWTWQTFICFMAAISMGLCFYITQRIKEHNQLTDADRSFDHIFSGLSCAYISFWLWSLVHQPWGSFSFCLEALVFVVLGAVFNFTRFRMYAYVILLFAALSFMFEPIFVSSLFLKWLIIGVNVSTFFVLYYIIKAIKGHNPKEIQEFETDLSFITGIVLLIVSIHQYINPQWISLSLGIASVFAILIGFYNGSKTERMGGMVMLALTLARVVFVDLSGLEIIFKIITLIILGVLFLGVSYIYNRFNINKNNS